MKTTTHRTITKLALELCKNRLSPQMQENCFYIVEGSVDEDEDQLIKRTTNWHFFRENDRIQSNKFSPIKVTSENILKRRVKKMLSYEKNNSKRYSYLGRVLHHIQDMSTPSHVIPVYHGPIKKDHFEGFMERNDCRINSDDVGSLPTDNIINNLPKDNIKNIVKSIRKIYDESAKDMLNNKLKIREDNIYSHFWKHYTKEENSGLEGFGAYGDCHKYFKKGKLPPNNPEGITMNDLLEIQDMVITHAIQSTCKALLYVDQVEL